MGMVVDRSFISNSDYVIDSGVLLPKEIGEGLVLRFKV